MISLRADSYAFFLAEVDAIHTLCDRALIPRTVEGELLSMSQRVTVLENCYRGVIRDLGKVDPTTFH